MSRLDVCCHILLPGHLAQCRKEGGIVIISCYSLYITASLAIDIQCNVRLLPFISLESNEYFMCCKKHLLYVNAVQLN